MQLETPRIDPTAFVAPGAQIHGDVEIGARAVIMFGVVVRSEFDRIEVGSETNLQDNVVLHADLGIPCRIGDRVTVGHAAVIHGATVGSNCLVGVGARVLNGSIIGEGAWLAAGSVLTEGGEIPPWTLAMGTPAKPVRELTEAEVERQRSGIEDYLRLAEAYRRSLGAQ
jgi:carbonic anhydrase/acetyltransferase-like protein (isoleucine patch superfamily)